MHRYKERDNSKAVCENCKSLVTTTFKYRDMEIKGIGVVKSILVAVCNNCNETIAIPNQSTEQIKYFFDCETKFKNILKKPL